MVVWDDLNIEERVKIYDTGIESQPESERRTIVPGYRVGDIYSPRLPGHEPLAGVVSHFAHTIRTGGSSPIGGDTGLRIVRMLEAAQRSLDANLGLLDGLSRPRA
jgi:predicted dehydrogenase